MDNISSISLHNNKTLVLTQVYSLMERFDGFFIMYWFDSCYIAHSVVRKYRKITVIILATTTTVIINIKGDNIHNFARMPWLRFNLLNENFGFVTKKKLHALMLIRT